MDLLDLANPDYVERPESTAPIHTYMKYLKDVADYRGHIELPEVDPATFSKENLAAMPEMGWLLECEFNLNHPYTTDLAGQKAELLRTLGLILARAERITAQDIPGGHVPPDYSRPLIALDTETTGLDVRCRYDMLGNLTTRTKIAGLCLGVSSTVGYYFPVLNTQKDGIPNWLPEAITYFIDLIHDNFTVIYHNSVYDREVCTLNGATVMPEWPAFFDTQILDFLYDVDTKTHGLKPASKRHLKRKMIELYELFVGFGGKSKKSEVVIFFEQLTASASYIYAGADAINTFALFKFYQNAEGIKNSFIHQGLPVSMDHRLVDTIRDMLRPGLPVNLRYNYYAAKDVLVRLDMLREAIYTEVGHKFDIGSPAQLSNILFNEYKIPPLDSMAKGAKGDYSTGEDILDELYEKYPDYLILRYIVFYRKLQSTLTKIYMNCLANSYTDALIPYVRVRLAFSQTNVPTGRLSSSSDNGKEGVVIKVTPTGAVTTKYNRGTWSAAFNSQGIPNPRLYMEKTKKITKVPPGAGIDLDAIYNDTELTNKFIFNAAKL